MKAIYNSRIIDQEDIQISTNNRAFCYGDGLFETIVTGPNRINLTTAHIQRLKADCGVLRLEFPQEIEDRIHEWINELSQLNGSSGDIRIRINVWRNEGGLYTPNTNSSEFLITIKKTQKPIFRINGTIGIAREVNNHFNNHSQVKSTNALNYVLAGIEKRDRRLDEIILLDDQGNLSETHIGNLFWIKDNTLYTPSLETGCIAGIMRKFILDFYPNTQVVKVGIEAIREADSVFSTNASGIEYFKKLESCSRELHDPNDFLADLLKRIQLP